MQLVGNEKSKFNMIDNYIYFYHTDTFIIIPAYPEKMTDTMSVEFSNETPLTRSAPIFSYSNSGPRSIDINLHLHRELMTQINYQQSNATVAMDDDYVDTLAKQIQAAVLPVYSASSKMVDPPIVAVRFGNEIFCKGIINGSVSTSYDLPILSNNKYSQVSIQFTLQEITPFDANQVMAMGSFRGLDQTLERNVWR